MLRQFVLIDASARILHSVVTLPPDQENLFADLQTGADLAQSLSIEDNDDFNQLLRKAREFGESQTLVTHHSLGHPIKLTVDWVHASNVYVVGLSSRESDRKLTDRQARVLRLLVEDNTLGQIADAMGVKVTTVQTYASRLRDKAGVSTNHGLSVWAMKTGNGEVD